MTSTIARTGDAPPVLEVGSLSHSFTPPNSPAKQVLHDIELRVDRAEFVSVMGPSGCGKTTFLNIVAGFVSAQSGNITMEGRSITSPSPERGVVFQKPHLFPWLNVLDNVMFGPRAMGWEKQRALDEALRLIKEVGLAGCESNYPHELSGGMQHRVAIARTLVTQPPLLLMDEPFAALDAQTRSDMQALLLRVWEAHRPTVLFVTHDIEEGLLLSDRVVVLSANPGEVQSVIDVPFARPRPFDVIFDSTFVELRSRIRAMMRRTE